MESISAAIRLILDTLRDISNNLNRQAQSHGELLKENKLQTQKIEELVSEIATCKKENIALKSENEVLAAKINDLEQYSKNFNLEIQGVPETSGENVYQIVTKIANFLGADINTDEIERCHRLGKSKIPNKHSGIIAKFYSRNVKEVILKGKKGKGDIQAEEIGFIGATSKIYVNEHLTKTNKHLFWLARAAKQIGYKFVWTRRGKIFIRKDEHSPVIHIAKPADIPVQ